VADGVQSTGKGWLYTPSLVPSGSGFGELLLSLCDFSVISMEAPGLGKRYVICLDDMLYTKFRFLAPPTLVFSPSTHYLASPLQPGM